MDDWSAQFNTWLDGIGTQVIELADLAETHSQTIADQLDRELTPLLESLFQPILDLPLELPDLALDPRFDQALDAIAQPWRQTIVPTMNDHPICSGCQHYHGQAYGDQMLVCGMYPFGPMADQTGCPDKQPIDWQEPWKTWFVNAGSPPNRDP
jgi:hypothetical protein